MGYRNLLDKKKLAEGSILDTLVTECLKTVENNQISSEQINSVMGQFTDDIVTSFAVDIQKKLLERGIAVLPYGEEEPKQMENPSQEVGEE